MAAMVEARRYGGASIQGGRAYQEDDWAVDGNVDAPVRVLAAVADGLGGHVAGDVAAQTAIRAFMASAAASRQPDWGRRLTQAMHDANDAVEDAWTVDRDLRGMGCTLVGGLLLADRLEWLSVGDSYVLICRDGELRRINPLHADVGGARIDARVRRGQITLEEARSRYHGDNVFLTRATVGGVTSALTSALMGGLIEEADLGSAPLRPGDLVLFASDGVETLDDAELVAVCERNRASGAQSVADGIVAEIEARDAPGQDNATVVVVCHDAG